MAVFLLNICKFNGCGITFPSLSDLIQHIEDTHIDYDPKVVEQKEQAQPTCLPLSYVLRFISEDARKENAFLASGTSVSDLKRKLAIKHHSYSMSSSNRSNTPTGSEVDEDDMVVSESEDSNDSWTTEEFSSEFIMRYGSRHSGSGSNGAPGNEKPFACPVPGCKKRYKNVNGIKYHSKNGHKKDGKVRKGYKCHCGKSYKTAQGLKSHAQATHNSTPENVLCTQQNNGSTINGSVSSSSVIIQRTTSPSQSLGSLSPSSISNMSSSAGSCYGGSGGSGANSNFGTHLFQHFSNQNVNNGVSSVCLTQANNHGTVNVQQYSSVINNPQQTQYPSISAITTTATLTIPSSSSVTATPATSVSSGNNLIRSAINLVTLKTNNSNNITNTASTKTVAATNLLAASAAASKILKLATNVAVAASSNQSNNNINNNVTFVEQQSRQQQQQNNPHHNQLNTSAGSNVFCLQSKLQQQNVSNNIALCNATIPSAKMTLPNLINLGILTPATSPTKTTQSLTLTNPQQQHHQSLSNALSNLVAATATATTTTTPVQQHHQHLLKNVQVNGNNYTNSNVSSNDDNSINSKNNMLMVEQTHTSLHNSSKQQQLPLTSINSNSVSAQQQTQNMAAVSNAINTALHQHKKQQRSQILGMHVAQICNTITKQQQQNLQHVTLANTPPPSNSNSPNVEYNSNSSVPVNDSTIISDISGSVGDSSCCNSNVPTATNAGVSPSDILSISVTDCNAGVNISTLHDET